MARESLKVLKLKQSQSTYVQLHNKVGSLLHCVFVKKTTNKQIIIYSRSSVARTPLET